MADIRITPATGVISITGSADFQGTGASSILFITGSGNVGIGTTSPASKLSVHGQFRVNTTSADGDENRLFFNPGGASDPAQLYLYNEAQTNTIYITANGSSYFNGGNVGIGTASPGAKLEVAGNIYANEGSSTAISVYNASSIRAKLSMTGNEGDLTIYSSAAAAKIYLSAYYASYFNGGNVGIGVTSPVAKLHIAGGDVWLNTVSTLQGMQFGFSGPSHGSYRAAVMGGAESYGGTDSGMLTFHTQNGYVVSSTPPERMRITSGGNVGIGTTTPGAARLNVVSDNNSNNPIIEAYALNLSQGIGLAYNGLQAIGSNADVDIVITPKGTGKSCFSTGNVGIGTTSPSARLSLGAASHGQRITWEDYSNVTSEYSSGDLWLSSNFYPNSGSSGYKTSVTAAYGAAGISVSGTGGGLNGVLKFFVDDAASKTAGASFTPTERMRITGGGNVGIGTTSPAAKLEVNGNIKLSSTAGSTSTPSNIWLGNDYSDGTTRNKLKVYLYNSGTEQYGFSVGPSSDVQYHSNILHDFYTANSLSVRINGSGNVGIGTASPVTGLDVRTSPYSNTTARFGTARPVYIINDDPIIGFNQYYNSGWKAGTTGYSGNVGVSNAGEMYFNVSTTSVVTDNLVTQREVMRILNNGNVGIGNSSPSGRVNISNALGANAPTTVTSANSYLHLGNSDYGPNNNGKFMIAFGYVGGSPNTNAPAYIGFEETNTGGSTKGALTFYTRDVITDTAPTERLYIASNGYVGIGTTSPSYPLHVSGSSGGISIYATNDIAAFSDESVKTELQIIDNAIDRIKQINGYTYVRIDDSSNIRRAGVIAQEVQKVLPEVVSENQDGTLNVAYSNMVALLIEGIKEQQSQIDELKQRLDNL